MLLPILALATTPSASSPKVIGASLFKNGYAMVSREIDLSGDGTVSIDEFPRGTLATFWVSASDGAKITKMIATTEHSTVPEIANSLDQVLEMNIGRTVKIGTRNGDDIVGKSVTGKLLTSGGIVIVKTESGIITFSHDQVTSVASSSGDLVYQRTSQTNKRVLKVDVKSPAGGKLYMVDLEPGMAWVPTYHVDITDPKKLSLTAKATVLDDTLDMSNIDLKFVTGFPNVLYLGFADPLTSEFSVEQFTGMVSNIAAAPPVMYQNMQSAGREAAAERRDMHGDFAMPTGSGEQAEDLFFYKQPNVSLKKGDHADYTVLEATSDFEHLYTLDLADTVTNNVEYRPAEEGPLDVWHSIKFKNTSGAPLTTGVGTVFKGGEVMGQDKIKYTSKEGEVLFRMSKALDVHAEATEEEVSRERGAIKNTYNQNVYDLVTLKGTIVIRNHKDEKLHMKITKDLTGEMATADDSPKTVKTAKGLTQVNPSEHLEWTPDLPANGSLTLTYTYKLYVRSA